MATRHILTLSCPDRPGIVHAVSGALLEVDANIVESSQFHDEESGRFCMRVQFEAMAESTVADAAIRAGVEPFGAEVTVRDSRARAKVMVLVSKADHCLVDLLYRWRSRQLGVDIAVIVSNHPDCAVWAARYDVPYVHLPVTADTRSAQEVSILRLVEKYEIDLVVLARYMQIVSDELCRELSGRIINIHHSFLPGFRGRSPITRPTSGGSS